MEVSLEELESYVKGMTYDDPIIKYTLGLSPSEYVKWRRARMRNAARKARKETPITEQVRVYRESVVARMIELRANNPELTMKLGKDVLAEMNQFAFCKMFNLQ